MGIFTKLCVLHYKSYFVYLMLCKMLSKTLYKLVALRTPSSIEMGFLVHGVSCYPHEMYCVAKKYCLFVNVKLSHPFVDVHVIRSVPLLA